MGMDEALLTYGHRIAEALNTAPEKTSKMFDLAQNLGIRIDTLIPVVSYLLSKDYLERINADQSGNDSLRLTEKGIKLLS